MEVPSKNNTALAWQRIWERVIACKRFKTRADLFNPTGGTLHGSARADSVSYLILEASFRLPVHQDELGAAAAAAREPKDTALHGKGLSPSARAEAFFHRAVQPAHLLGVLSDYTESTARSEEKRCFVPMIHILLVRHSNFKQLAIQNGQQVFEEDNGIPVLVLIP